MIGPFGLKPKGTMAVRALPLAKTLAQRGHDVTLILPPWSYPVDAGRNWQEDGVRIANTTIVPRARIPFELVSGARAFGPDVVHIFKPKGYSGIAQWLIWQWRRIGGAGARIVLDEDDWEGAGGWNELEHYSGAQKRFFAWQERWGLTHADGVTVASRALESIVWSLGVSRERVLYLPNGVNALPTGGDSRAQVRSELQLGQGPIILLYTRFFEFELARLGEILSRVFANAPEAKLLIVGKGLYGEEKQFLELANIKGWRERVVDAGWVEMTRLRAFMTAGDVAIYPFADTLVNRTKAIVKLMDLLANGIAVVADSVGQIREYIRDGANGMLVAPNDVEGFARRVVELLNDPEMRARMGTCAAETMARDYDWSKLAAMVEGVYLAPGASRERDG